MWGSGSGEEGMLDTDLDIIECDHKSDNSRCTTKLGKFLVLVGREWDMLITSLWRLMWGRGGGREYGRRHYRRSSTGASPPNGGLTIFHWGLFFGRGEGAEFLQKQEPVGGVHCASTQSFPGGVDGMHL